MCIRAIGKCRAKPSLTFLWMSCLTVERGTNYNQGVMACVVSAGNERQVDVDENVEEDLYGAVIQPM